MVYLTAVRTWGCLKAANMMYPKDPEGIAFPRGASGGNGTIGPSCRSNGDVPNRCNGVSMVRCPGSFPAQAANSEVQATKKAGSCQLCPTFRWNSSWDILNNSGNLRIWRLDPPIFQAMWASSHRHHRCWIPLVSPSHFCIDGNKKPCKIM